MVPQSTGPSAGRPPGPEAENPDSYRWCWPGRRGCSGGCGPNALNLFPGFCQLRGGSGERGSREGSQVEPWMMQARGWRGQ